MALTGSASPVYAAMGEGGCALSLTKNCHGESAKEFFRGHQSGASNLMIAGTLRIGQSCETGDGLELGNSSQFQAVACS